MVSMGSKYGKLHFGGCSIDEAAVLRSLVVWRTPVNTEDLSLFLL
jgi:hypothetical protein